MSFTFADVLPIEQLSSHQYAANLNEKWVIGTVPNGGYVASCFMLVASKHMLLTHGHRKQPHVLNFHLEYFKRTSVGSARFTVKDIKIGSRISNLHVTLAQSDGSDASDHFTDEVEGYFTMSNMSSETGPSFETGYTLKPEPLPVSLPALLQGQDVNFARRYPDPFASFRKALYNLQMYVMRPTRRPSHFPHALIDQWLRFTPPECAEGRAKWTNDALGYVVDIFPQMLESFINPVIEQAVIGHKPSPEETKELWEKRTSRSMFWYPTLLLNLDVKGVLPQAGVDWLFCRVQAKSIKNGRYDLDVQVFDEQNQLIATSSHLVLAVDSSRNTNRNKKKSSKI